MKHIDKFSIFKVTENRETAENAEKIIYHIEKCSKCSTYYKQFVELNNSFHSHNDIEVPSSSYSNILSMIERPEKKFTHAFSLVFNILSIFLVFVVGAASFYAGNKIGSTMQANKVNALTSIIAETTAEEYPSGSIAETIMSLNK